MSEPPLALPQGDRECYDILERNAQAILQQINELRRQLAQVRLRQNALLPIHRAPDDVLLTIFALLVQPAAYGMLALPHDLINTSHVCARWRAVSVNSPTLWREIPVFSTAQAKTFLERSRTLPVRVSLARRFPGYLEEMTNVLAPHIGRLRGFSLSTVWTREDMEWFMDELGDPAPMLEELSLVMMDDEDESGDDSEYGDDEGIGRRQPPPIFSASHPSLRSLTLGGVYYPYATHAFTNLRHLHLSSQPSEKLNGQAIFSILRRCPGLETLELHDLEFERTSQDTRTRAASVALPRLASLELHDVYVEHPMIILRPLVLPPTTRIVIGITDAPGGANARGHTLKLPKYPASLPSLSGLRSLQLAVGVSLHDAGYEGQPFTLCAGDQYDPMLALDVDLFSKDEPGKAWIHKLSSLLDVSTVESYDITFDGRLLGQPFTAKMWRAALKDLTALRTLRVCAPDAIRRPLELAPEDESARARRTDSFGVHSHLLDALAADGDARVCPLLEALEIEGVRCDEEFWAGMWRVVEARRAPGWDAALKSVWVTNAAEIGYDRHPLVLEVSALVDDFELESSCIHGWVGEYYYY